MLNKQDQQKLNKCLDNPEFLELYNELIFLRTFRYPDLVVQCFPLNGSGKNGLISPKDLDRRDLKLRIVTAKTQTIPLEIACILATELHKEAKILANRLAYFFPSAQHRRWLTIFTLIAINGHDNAARIEQRQSGGQKGLTKNEINLRLKILNDVETTKKRLGITFAQACARLSGKYNQHLVWSSVKKWRKYRKNGN